ncbi:MAG: phytanoyl-CoA dioxygenase family protein [Planctomycetota bacterium]
MSVPQAVLATPDIQPRRLTQAERAAYDRDGFVVIPDVMSRQEVALIDAEITRLRATQNHGDGEDANFILALGNRSSITQQVCRDERVLTLIEDIVHPGIAIYSAKMVEKLPNDSAICHWHQDDAYYVRNSQSACRMSTWLPLQDTDERNGGLWVVPGSHQWGLRESQLETTGHCRRAFSHGADEIDGAIPVRIHAGDVLLFHALLWHRSLGNQTNQTRRSFIVSYQDALATAGNGSQHKILRPV